MYRIINIIMLPAIVCLSSCAPRKVVIQTHQADSMRTSERIEYVERLRDTTIYIQLPVETREVIRCDSSLLETSAAVSMARINTDGTLLHTLQNKIGAHPVTVPVKDVHTDTIRDTMVIRESVREIPVRIPLSWWQQFWIRSGQIIWSMIFLSIAIMAVHRRLR